MNETLALKKKPIKHSHLYSTERSHRKHFKPFQGAQGKDSLAQGAASFSVGSLAGVQKLGCIASSGGYWFEMLLVTAAFCSFPNLFFFPLGNSWEFEPWN